MTYRKIRFSKDNQDYSIDCPSEANVYGLAQILDKGEAQDIKICTVYETFDDLYLQGRSTRNLPSVPPPQRQLDLF